MKKKAGGDSVNPYVVLVLPDMHVPAHDTAAYDAILQYIRDERFDEFVQLGDFLDLDSVSSHKPEAILEREGARIQEEFDAGNVVLDELTDALSTNNKSCRKVLLKGNHEWRLDRYIEENPSLHGALSIETALNLKDRGIEYVECYPSGDLYQIGHAYFFHGIYTGSNHAKKHVDHFGVNMFYGHVHSVQTHSKQIHGKGTTIVGQSLGCLCEYNPPYMIGRPNDWQLAFAVFWFRPDGMFNYSVIRIFEGGFFAPNGKFYQGVATPKAVRTAFQPKHGEQKIKKSAGVRSTTKNEIERLFSAYHTLNGEVVPGANRPSETKQVDPYDFHIEIEEPTTWTADLDVINWYKGAIWESGFIATKDLYDQYKLCVTQPVSYAKFGMEMSRVGKKARRGDTRGYVL